MNTHKAEAKTYFQFSGEFGMGVYEEYRDIISLDYSVYTDNRVEFTNRVLLTREQAEQLLKDLQKKLYGAKQQPES